jgi:hypothetical protein
LYIGNSEYKLKKLRGMGNKVYLKHKSKDNSSSSEKDMLEERDFSIHGFVCVLMGV